MFILLLLYGDSQTYAGKKILPLICVGKRPVKLPDFLPLGQNGLSGLHLTTRRPYLNERLSAHSSVVKQQ